MILPRRIPFLHRVAGLLRGSAARASAFYLGLALTTLGAVPALAQNVNTAGCDIPLIIEQGSVTPNVLVILDTSGSMNEAIYHQDYDPSVVWKGVFRTNRIYGVGRDGWYSPRAWSSRWPSSPSAPLVKGQFNEYGRYLGNYLNWIYFHATDAQRASLPQTTRIEVGKTAIKAVLSQAVGLRYGFMIYHYDNGGILKAPLGTPQGELFNIIDNAQIQGWTPSAETMEDALRYFQQSGGSAPIQYACQQNFIILVTDGFPTKDVNLSIVGDEDGDGNEDVNSCAAIGAPYSDALDCSDYLDDVAYYMSHNDLRKDLDGAQNVFTYTIGFGFNAPLLVDTAVNGMGLSLVAWDLNSLINSLGAVVGDIVSRISSGAAVAVVSSEQTNGEMVFRGKFLPGLWRGFLEGYSYPFQQGDAPLWEAGSLLAQRNAYDRLVYTFHNGAMTVFHPSLAADLQQEMNVPTVADAENTIRYVLGEDMPGLRDRNGWKLGDLVYSTPLVVGPPNEFRPEPSYQAFLTSYENRDVAVYVGSNDGMLHAFRATDGQELWAYVPQGVLPNLPALSDPNYCHKSYVDLSPTAHDMQINGTWRTVLFGGLRNGGNSYFAIDVTDPNSPYTLWETAIPAIGLSFTIPEVIEKPERTYLWVGSGPSGGGEAVVALIDMKTGQYIGATDPSFSPGVTNMASAATGLDIDFDGMTDFVYHGDLAGNLWRWDVSAADPASWWGHILYSGNQPIQSQPIVAIGPSGEPLIYFGTGKYVESSDLSDGSLQSFVAVRDNLGDAVFSKSDLADQTYTINSLEGQQGWFIDLVQGTGERVVDPAAIVDGVVYFTSFAPSTSPCSAGGHSWLYGVDFLDGSKPDKDGKEQDVTAGRITDLGDGIASMPVVNLAQQQVIVQTSDARLNVQTLSTRPEQVTVRAWREKY